MPRKKPFSGKKKREQLKAKRLQKKGTTQSIWGNANAKKPKNYQPAVIVTKDTKTPASFPLHLNPKTTGKNRQQKSKAKSSDQGRNNRLVSFFIKETDEEIEMRKEQSMLPVERTFHANIADSENFYGNTVLDLPKRPAWTKDTSKEKLENNEKECFTKWLQGIYSAYPRTRLNHFEHNLEVWRQLWRVIERSDVVLVVTDSRYPLFHFPPSLYKYLHDEVEKPVVLILNKIDLVPQAVLESWVEYFKGKFPDIYVVIFSSYPHYQKEEIHASQDVRLDSLVDETDSLSELEKITLGTKYSNTTKLLEKKRRKYRAIGGKELLDVCLNIPSIKEKLEAIEKAGNGFVTLGTVGHPNVGKSSLINGLMGKVVVSTSISPGHTKHLQTIFLRKTVQLCDCPGLTFPAVDMPRPLQIIAGLYPIAQVREPYTSVGYLAQFLPLEKIYGLDSSFMGEKGWSAWEICEALAEKKGFYYHGGSFDCYRSGGIILKDAVGGLLPLFFFPPNHKVDVDILKSEEDARIAALENEEQEEQDEQALLEEEQMTNDMLSGLI